VLASVHGSQAISVVDSMKPAAPTKAASGRSASPRRNQYIARPAATSFSSAGTVSAHVGGSAHASHVSGNRQAVCGFEKNGAPAYAYGFQSGARPARTSRAAQSVHGWKTAVTSPSAWLGCTGPGAIARHGAVVKRLSSGDSVCPGRRAGANRTSGRAINTAAAARSGCRRRWAPSALMRPWYAGRPEEVSRCVRARSRSSSS
jgi:hypothetical protein